jgi:exodeoxyribonuclease V alpha subunit
MALPTSLSPLLTRELIYTGITRAKSRLDLYADPSLLAQAIRRKTERYSGLAERLVENTK